MTMAKLLLCPLALCLLLPLPCCSCLSTSVEGSREKQQMRKALALRKSIVAQVAAVSGGVPNGALEGTVSQLRHDVDALLRLEESLSGHLSTARDRVAITPHAEAAQAVMKSPAYQNAKHMKEAAERQHREHIEREADVMAQHAAAHSRQEQLANKSAAKLFSEKMQVLREAAAAREAACAKAGKGGAPAAALPTEADTDEEECNPCTTNDN
ncbi:unnamed protein product [Vitrella brassicaformis CCMP3155]|uniref:Uncharacterized protein n=1 Tax=Vitrella brassicaformis (strain CCMP3155) TaxID=1169540 RepID=A0A0G4H6M5_VITBC|nr:unnamed protein product [Vitrella brassicaformis CCMP3155]|eukprot:CEM39309.1 unnamed protein product [Vitrella brassicaformis CCMP3155]